MHIILICTCKYIKTGKITQCVRLVVFSIKVDPNLIHNSYTAEAVKILFIQTKIMLNI